MKIFLGIMLILPLVLLILTMITYVLYIVTIESPVLLIFIGIVIVLAIMFCIGEEILKKELEE